MLKRLTAFLGIEDSVILSITTRQCYKFVCLVSILCLVQVDMRFCRKSTLYYEYISQIPDPTCPFIPGIAIRCHRCSGVSDPHFCPRTVTCAPDEECYTEKVIGDDSAVFYNSGCRKTQLCKMTAQGRRRSDLHLCEGCCGSDLCNSELCPPGNSSVPGLHCYQCDQVDDPTQCQNRISCSDGELCIIQKYVDTQMQVKYSLGCESKTRCDILMKYGRRDTQMCNECCDTPGCNRHVCGQGTIQSTQAMSSSTATTSPSSLPSNSSCRDYPDIDCQLADDTHGICAQHTMAAEKYCQKYCGYCSDGTTHVTHAPPTGTTEDPCRDSGDIDCKQMNDSLHICEKKDSPPTLLYCPKYCGICTPKVPACSDSPDVDCRMLNSTQNICALRTLAATKFCNKFCDYCLPDGSTRPPPPPPTGTTVDPCQDSGDIDCQQMNTTLNICAQKTAPPTMIYCPKYCGICTPSSGNTQVQTTTEKPCKDSGDIDCKQMDQSLGICAKKNPATLKYCPKYCNLC